MYCSNQQRSYHGATIQLVQPDVRLFIQPTTVSINNNPISIQENTALSFTLNINPEPIISK